MKESENEEPTEFKSAYNHVHRWAALSFIGLLVAGNIWLGYYVAGGVAPQWVQGIFFACIVSALTAGFGLLIQKLLARFDDRSH